jgi:CRP/FNR family transcriptional regulator, cyclic AMP receptor protein
MTPVASAKAKLSVNPNTFLTTVGKGKSIVSFPKKRPIFVQGDHCDAVYYIQTGKVKLTVFSSRGKEAVIGLWGEGDFFGDGCLAGQLVQLGTASTVTDCTLLRIDKEAMKRALHADQEFSDAFVAHLLTRNMRYEEDLLDQLFNSSEKRLARILLLLARFGKDGLAESTDIPDISQETLAEMVGTTRPRVTFFMNKFRRLGFIDYNGGLQVHSSLLSVVLHD